MRPIVISRQLIEVGNNENGIPEAVFADGDDEIHVKLFVNDAQDVAKHLYENLRITIEKIPTETT